MEHMCQRLLAQFDDINGQQPNWPSTPRSSLLGRCHLRQCARWHVTSWNRGRTPSGHSAAEMIGRSVLILLPVGRQLDDEPALTKGRRGQETAHLRNAPGAQGRCRHRRVHRRCRRSSMPRAPWGCPGSATSPSAAGPKPPCAKASARPDLVQDESMGITVSRVDDRRMVEVNDAWLEMMGSGATRSWAGPLPNSRSGRSRRVSAGAAARSRPTGPCETIRPAFDPLAHRWRARWTNPVDIGGVAYYATCCVDITLQARCVKSPSASRSGWSSWSRSDRRTRGGKCLDAERSARSRAISWPT
jgi:hypothetical protein